ncbi:hypothetical protein [Zhihengliuella sp.]|uniref:hypothetical protein n=1 Tax=Zhihengliuella sp. TaxID=1954483 RepID=UPI002810D1F0|nr:hypothetical protein [Zhihengliuella sp.]
MVAGGSPGRISIIAAETGAVLKEIELPATDGMGTEDSASAWAVAIDSARSLAFVGTTDGRSFLVDTGSFEVFTVEGAPAEDLFFERAVPDGAGGFLATTYGEGRLLHYSPSSSDPGKGRWREYGPFGDGNDYTIALASVGNYAYVGTGTRDPAVFRVRLADGQIQRIDLPGPEDGREADRSFVYDLAVSGDYLFARVDPENRIYVRALSAATWIDSIDGAAPGLAVAPPGSSRAALFYAGTDQRLYEYDPTTRQQPVRRSMEVSALRGAGWMRPGAAGSDHLVTTTVTGTLLLWDRASDESTRIRSEVRGGSRLIRSLGLGPSGELVAGAFGTTYSVATYRPKPLPASFVEGDADFGTLPSQGQIEAFCTHGYDLFAGSYPGASLRRLLRTNPLAPPAEQRPIDRSHLTEGGLASLVGDRHPDGRTAVPDDDAEEIDLAPGEQQDRPVALLSHAGFVIVGTAPDYGRIGGALTVVDPELTWQRTYRDTLDDHTPLCLAPGVGHSVIVGTGPGAGLGANVPSGHGRVVAMDVRSGEILASVTPVPGERNVSALAVDEADGTLWGITGSAVFQLRRDGLEVLRSEVYEQRSDSERYVTGRALYDAHEKLIGCARGRLFEIDKRTLTRRVLGHGTNLVRLESGEIYYSRGSQLFRQVH